MQENNLNNDFSLRSTISFILRNKKILIITFFVSAIVIGLLSLLLPNYFKSQVLIQPSETYAISKSVLSQMDNYDALEFGKEKNAEHTLEILTSRTILWKISEKFNLAEYYGIDGEGQAKSDKLNKKIESNIKIKRTENLGVKITVWDKDPQMAANIANYIAYESQVLRSEIKKSKMDSLLSALVFSRDRMKSEIKQIEDSLSVLSKETKIFNSDMMSDRMSQELSKQIAAGNSAAIARLEERMSYLGEKGSEVYTLRERLKNKIESLRVWEEKLEQVRIDSESNVPTDFIIDTAYVSDLKDKPKRSIIAIVGGISCTLLATFVLIIRERVIAVRTKNEPA